MRSQSTAAVRLAKASLLGLGIYLVATRLVRHRRRFDLRGRTVLITGGSRGLGFALAREFAARGAQVAICARDEQELASAADQIDSAIAKVHTFKCDLQDSGQISQLITDVQAALGNIDVLVNNAGTIIVGPAENMTADDFKQAMDLNFWAAVHTTRAVIPAMVSQGGGRIVNIASIGGKMPVPHLAAYCASKFALVGFSGAMRTEFAKDGILTTTVCPGLMRTGSPRNAPFKGNHQAEYAWFSISDALPGISMDAQRAARLIVQATLCGDAQVTLGLPAKISSLLYGMFPNLFIEFSALINRLFPSADPTDEQTKPGWQSESWITRSFLRHLGRLAEKQYNQLHT